jgi:predicted alpha-1,2-mannosidase
VAEYDTARVTKKMPRSMMKDVMPVGRYYKNLLGYIPCDKDVESVAKALEYAYNDWCIAVLAKGLGEKETAEKYSKFAKAYEHYYDSVTGFMRGKLSNGEWRTPFDPHHSRHRSDDYCEGTAYQWNWFVPHDVPGLMQLMGGESVFAARLDSLFAASSHLTGAASGDISGLIGQYAHGNEPSHHIIHLYNYANRPWRTQELVDSVLYSQYHNTPKGLSGNEDCGQMSAWYILNAMGFYQICPGEPIYSIGRPILNQAKINLRNGKTFTIRTVNNSRQNKYIASIQLNGKKLDKPFFTHEDLMKGGELVIEMSANH